MLNPLPWIIAIFVNHRVGLNRLGWFSVDSTFKGEAIKVADFEQHRPKGHPLTIDAGSKYYKITGGKCENISRDEIILVSSGISLNSRQWRANMLVEF